MKNIKQLLFSAFMRANPTILVIVLLVSYFSEEKALAVLRIEKWILIITFVLAIPQMITNYRENKEK